MKSKIFILIFVVCAALFSKAEAKIYIDINAPADKKLPIAIPDIKNSADLYAQTDIGIKLQDVLINDLNLSGLFDIIDRKVYIEDQNRVDKKSDEIDFNDWRLIGADAVIKGLFTANGDELTVELKLFDVFQAKMLTGRRYIGKKTDIRTIAHKFANEIMEAITGEKGTFDARLLFTSTISGNKEIWMCDYDGYNAKQITKNKSINLSPQWSPDGKKILYTSYKQGQPFLYMLELATGKELRIANEPGINIGARWSPTGQEIALTLSRDGNPELYILELDNMKFKRLTNNWAIDVSPSWSPDGKKLVFVSDIGGNPHIYMINSDGAGVTRLTYNGKYNASPVWSSKGDKIAFTRLEGGRFDIWVMNADGTGQIQITSNSGNNENPSLSPDGRHIVFTSTREGITGIYIMRSNGENQSPIIIENKEKWNPGSPVWSPSLK